MPCEVFVARRSVAASSCFDLLLRPIRRFNYAAVSDDVMRVAAQIPVFFLGLAELAINIAAAVCPLFMSRNAGIAYQVMALFGQIAIMFMLGIAGNKMTAKHSLARGCALLSPSRRRFGTPR